ncbi:hypothetical protein ECZU17_50650 [Escherichia coli]|nr:hypothetical protein ECZU17_50650 [Escherichia coli]
MRILAIDTATEACSVALWNDGTVNAHFELCPREHTQRILPMVQDILTTSGTSLTDINALAYGRGPGSFTGVRIGIGIAQGLALGAELPMIGVSTLMTMAQGRGAKTAQPACWLLLMRGWAKFTGPNISVMKTVSGTVKKPKLYSNPNSFMNGCNSFPANG